MRPKWTRVAITLTLVIVALSALDRFLARVESAEMHSTAQRSYRAGSRLLAAGKAAEAIDPLREAHAVERENSEYQLALITALMDAGHPGEAESLMDEIVERMPNDGKTNLVAARLAEREGSFTESEAFYHRAIYGAWPTDAPRHRIETRMELIDRLLKRRRKQEMLGELISLDAETGLGPEERRRLAHLFLEADSPARAAGVYQQLIARDPKDIAAYEGLGEAELEQGRYNAARAAFLQASFHEPANASIRDHLQTLNTVVGLDPTLRQLTSEEKYRRSVRILDMARTALGECSPRSPILASADAAISGKPPAHVTNEAAEGVLSLAEMVWRARNDACGARANGEEVLDLLMKKLSAS